MKNFILGVLTSTTFTLLSVSYWYWYSEDARRVYIKQCADTTVVELQVSVPTGPSTKVPQKEPTPVTPFGDF